MSTPLLDDNDNCCQGISSTWTFVPNTSKRRGGVSINRQSTKPSIALSNPGIAPSLLLTASIWGINQ